MASTPEINCSHRAEQQMETFGVSAKKQKVIMSKGVFPNIVKISATNLLCGAKVKFQIIFLNSIITQNHTNDDSPKTVNHSPSVLTIQQTQDFTGTHATLIHLINMLGFGLVVQKCQPDVDAVKPLLRIQNVRWRQRSRVRKAWRGRLHINVNVGSCLSCLVLSFASKNKEGRKGYE